MPSKRLTISVKQQTSFLIQLSNRPHQTKINQISKVSPLSTSQQVTMSSSKQCECFYKVAQIEKPQPGPGKFAPFKALAETKLNKLIAATEAYDKPSNFKAEALKLLITARSVLTNFNRERTYRSKGLSTSDKSTHISCQTTQPIIHAINDFIIHKKALKLASKNLINTSTSQPNNSTTIQPNNEDESAVNSILEILTNNVTTSTDIATSTEVALIDKLPEQQVELARSADSTPQLSNFTTPQQSDRSSPHSLSPLQETPPLTPRLNPTFHLENYSTPKQLERIPPLILKVKNQNKKSSEVVQAFKQAIKICENEPIIKPFLYNPTSLERNDDKKEFARYLRDLADSIEAELPIQTPKRKEREMENEEITNDEEKIIKHQSRGNQLFVQFEKQIKTASGSIKKALTTLKLEEAIEKRKQATTNYFKNLEATNKKSFNPTFVKYGAILSQIL